MSNKVSAITGVFDDTTGALKSISRDCGGASTGTPTPIAALSAAQQAAIDAGGSSVVVNSSGVLVDKNLSPVSGGVVSDGAQSPLDIGSCEMWVDAFSGMQKSDWTDCTAAGDALLTWLDKSGNGRHLNVQGAAPTYSPTGGKGGGPAVQFATGSRLYSPAFLTAAMGQAFTVVVVSKAPVTPHTANNLKVSVQASGGNFWLGNTGSTLARDITCQGVTGLSQVNTACPALDGIDVFSAGGTNVRVCSDGFSFLATGSQYVLTQPVTSVAVPWSSSAMVVGGLTGGGYDWQGTISEVVVFSKYLSDSELQNLFKYLRKKHSIKPLVVLLGNSLTSGQGSTGGATQTQSAVGTNLPSLLISRLPAADIRSDAYPGRTTKAIANESPACSGVYGRGGRVVTHLWEITNTVNSAGSSAEAIEYIKKLVADHRATGDRVVVGTCLPRGDAAIPAKFEGLRSSVNAWLRTSYASAGITAICDYAANSNLQDYNNTTYFNADKVHLTDAGYVVAAGIAASVIAPLLL